MLCVGEFFYMLLLCHSSELTALHREEQYKVAPGGTPEASGVAQKTP